MYSVHGDVYAVHMTEVGTGERIASAAAAIVAEEGAKAVTIRRVAAAAGVSAMATYRHYSNREELLHAVADNTFAGLSKRWGQRTNGLEFASRFYGLLEDFLDFALGKPKLYTFLITERREGVRRFPEGFTAEESPLFGPVVETVEQGMHEGVLRPDDPIEVTLALTAQTMGLVQLYLGGRIGLSDEDFRALCVRSVERMLDGFKA